MKRFTVLVLGVLLACAGAWAQAASAGGPADSSAGAGAGGSEDDFFGSGDVEAKQGAAETQKPAEVIEKERLGFSGQLQAQSTYTMTRGFVQGTAPLSDNTFANAIVGDFLVDARLPKSFRMFMDVNVDYVPTGAPVPVTGTAISPVAGPLSAFQNQTTILNIKEVFVDFNVANTVYFRAGKQVLQWGVGYFWNPTDLINVEHKSFTNLNALLEGTFGLRTDVTFSQAFHLYTFINLNGVQDLSAIAYSARSEFLVGTVEFGLAAWYKYNEVPVFGADLSMPLFWSLNLTAEGSLSWGDPSQKYDPVTGPYSVSNQLVPKVDVGLSRTFDAFDVKDRVTVMAEFFWNSDGYDQNMFQILNPLALPAFAAGYYRAGYYGQYYGALFITINSFGLSNMTLSLNGLMNFSDSSAVALVGLSYAPISNFTLQLQLGSYLGADNREYTISFNPTTGAVVNNMFFVILGATVTF